MEINSLYHLWADLKNISLKQNAKTPVNTSETSKQEFDKKVSDLFKPSKTDEEKDKHSKVFTDSTYRHLTTLIKKANISNREKKQILQMIVSFFKNKPDEKMKLKFAKQISSLIAVKANADQANQNKKSTTSGSIYGRQSINEYLNTLENDAIAQLKLNEELEQITENL